MKYQPNERGNDIFDVAVSTQLFNNRVVVNGNIGNKQQTSSSSQNDVVGDLDIEIKIDRSGALRLNIFSHSADQYTNFLDNSQRNGVGLTYQTEFSSFGKFLRNMFSSRKKRREARLAEEQAMLEEGRIVLNIPKDIDENGRDKR
jgi:flavorubredoxin